MEWYVIPHGKAHAKVNFQCGEIEFWCGKQREPSEVRKATDYSPKCKSCLESIKNTPPSIIIEVMRNKK